MQGFHNLCETIEVSIAQEKTVGPSAKNVFWGLEISIVDMDVSIP